MALGGGTFTLQNKELPGTYINFVSAASSTPSLSDRGIVTMPLELDWGVTGEIFTVTNEDFADDSINIFGYPYNHEKMKGLRDLFRHTQVLHAYRLNSGGVKASNSFAEAKYPGTRGNDLKIVIQQNADDSSLYDVQTVLETMVVDEQTVVSAAFLEDNGFVAYNKDATLAVTAATPLTGGDNGSVDGASHQAYLDAAESCTYNAMGIVSTDETIKKLYSAYVRRMREEMGVKFQVVLHQMPADYYGVVNVSNKTTDKGWPEASLVYWVAGIIAGCEVNKSNQNMVYDGEFLVDTVYTQAMLRKALKAGELVLHNVGDEIRVLADINSMVTLSENWGEVFRENQTIRVIDQISNDIAVLFNTKYLGVMPNDNAGRVSLWSDIVKHHKQLNDIRAIEDFEDTDVVVTEGKTKKSVVVTDNITVVNAMDKLYMTVTVA